MHYMDTVTVHDSTKWSCHSQYQCHAWVILVTDTTDSGLEVRLTWPQLISSALLEALTLPSSHNDSASISGLTST